MEKIKTLVIVSGYFNPLHEGHLEYLNRSKALGDFLFVIINNDASNCPSNQAQRYCNVPLIKCP